MFKTITFAIPGVLLLLATGTSHAVTTTYTDRTAWAGNGQDFYTEDFEGFTSDTSFADSPLDVGPFTLQTNGYAADRRNIVDVKSYLFKGAPASFGNAAVDVFIDQGLTASIVFDTAVEGFFADFLYAGNSSRLTLTLFYLEGGSKQHKVPGPGDSLSPFGVWSSGESITSIEFSNSLNDGFYIDNLSATGSVLAPAVPVPAAMWLFASALVAFVGFSRRRNQPG